MNFDIRSLNPWAYALFHLVVSAMIIVVPQLLMKSHVGDLTVSAVVIGLLNWLEAKSANNA